ncbi:hypothetical protein [Caulobacter mirabilis]|uniref:TonB C-terminal domain-containing protein n=1 Tax=Caulobacter mirabilis TaxID=69666 RepID=A0A2D2B2E2_9CAUL|nr:hypothetical protein [Caulobacter mirabilis]ATQ44435.1 hypothetical protein CSW64_19630 [Caulobacter mirabilis]
MILTSLAAASLMFAAAPDTALAYAEARVRAEKYEDDPAATRYRETILQPVLGKSVRGIFDACGQGATPAGRPNFSVILSFKGGKLDAVRQTTDNPVAQCVADRLARLDYPAPPYPDFAEELHLEMSPAK